MTDEVEKHPQSLWEGDEVWGNEEDSSSWLWSGLQLWVRDAKAVDYSEDGRAMRRGCGISAYRRED